MTAFPRCTTSCATFGTCDFHPYCSAWPNPLERAEQPPIGFTEYHWNPRILEETAKVVTRDGKLEVKT
jgi:hypothetical protein